MKHSLNIAAGLLYLFLYAPIAVVVVYSFNASRFGTSLGPSGRLLVVT